ncbi:MAG: hypothetical protein ACRDSJ_08805 [Rubrobacteraceae bacterium]
MVQFRKRQRRHDEGATSYLHSFEKEFVVFLTVVEDGEQFAGVNDEGQRPKP